MLIDQENGVSRDIVAHQTDPEFWDVRIICSDGCEIAANKSVLGMRSQYFRSMFSVSNNFVESQAGCVKMPYPRAILDKMILYLYSGQLDCDEMSLRALMSLLELFNLMNLAAEYGVLESYTSDNIKKGKFLPSDCIKRLEDSSKLGLKAVGETLLSHLGGNFSTISQIDEVKSLSEPLIIRLLLEKREEKSQTIFRLKTFALWLSVNSMDDAAKSEVLKLFNFEDFTFKELTSDVRKSEFYPVDKIMARMEELYEAKDTFRITPPYVRQCDTWFEELEDVVVLVEDVRDFLMEKFSGQVADSTLDKILELCDQDKDGELDQYEFKAACHLAARSKVFGDEIPDQVFRSSRNNYIYIAIAVTASTAW